MGGSGGFVFTIYFFLASWLRRWRQRPAPAAVLPIYSAGLTPSPAPAPESPPPAPEEPPAPAAAPLPTLDQVLSQLPMGEHRMWWRVEEYCRQYGVCTACNATLGKNWHDDGSPCDDRHVRRLLSSLAARGILEGWHGRYPTAANRTGRALRTCAPKQKSTRRQLELRLRDERLQRLQPHELAQGFADPPPPFVERRGAPAPEQVEGGRPPDSLGMSADVRRTSADLGSGSDPPCEVLSRDRDRREREGSPGSPGPADKEAAPRGATDGAPVYSLDDRRSYRERAAERRGRWAETFLPAEQHKLPSEVCRQLLDGIPERRRDGVLLGYLYATMEEREQAAGRLPLRAPPPPPCAAPPPPVATAPPPEAAPAPAPCPAAAAVWDDLRAAALVGAPAHLESLYVAPLVPVALAGDVLVLWTPSRYIRDAVLERLRVVELAEQAGRRLRWLVADEPPLEASA